jgi:arylsulfatase A-like enzyme
MRNVALFALCGLTALPVLAQAPPTPTRPNIVVLLSDDAGYGDFGFQKNADPKLAALTPRLTRLAREGVVFTDAYVSGAVCSPSRAGLLTGRYQQRFGHENNLPANSRFGLPLEEKLIGDRLKPLGYTSGLIGKWHLGYAAEYRPNQRGFGHTYLLSTGCRPFWRWPEAGPIRPGSWMGRACSPC